MNPGNVGFHSLLGADPLPEEEISIFKLRLKTLHQNKYVTIGVSRPTCANFENNCFTSEAGGYGSYLT